MQTGRNLPLLVLTSVGLLTKCAVKMSSAPAYISNVQYPTWANSINFQYTEHTATVYIGYNVSINVDFNSQASFPASLGLHISGNFTCFVASSGWASVGSMPTECITGGNNMFTTCSVKCTATATGSQTLLLAGVNYDGEPVVYVFNITTLVRERVCHAFACIYADACCHYWALTCTYASMHNVQRMVHLHASACMDSYTRSR